MSNTKKCLIGLVVVIFGLAIVFKFINWGIAKVTAPDKGIAVTEETIELKSIKNDIVYAAKVEAENSIPVILKASGEVQTVNVKLGDRVNEGDILFTINPKDIQKNVNAASAAYQAATAGVKAAKANYDSVNNGTIEAQVIQTKAQRDSLEAQYNFAKEAKELGGISEVDFNTIEASFIAADKQYQQLVANGVTGSVQSALAQYENALAASEQARIAYESARDMLNDARVKAPISGVVAQLNVKEKNTLQAGMTPVMIVNADNLEINLSVSENVVSLLHQGDEVEVKLNQFPDETFKGIIDGLSTAAGQTSTYPLVIKLPNEDGRIKSGMFGKVIFSTNQVDDTIVISTDNLIENGDEKYVFIEDKKKVKKVVVETGINNGQEVQILSGLKVGDKLITKGQDYLQDGDDVRVVEG
ncbi:MAG: efflux RND transporter periplasmic adaptor subunit [Clostridia bacterium]|nr:efflux RND transporter periplasmic adaptor subunit [Clostridia bacterium]